jgi:UDP-N-acetylmuramate--alanine ligase
MHIYFSGIGAGTGPLALLAYQAGYDVTCSDKQNHEYVSYLKKHGVKNIHIGQTKENIELINEKKPINWLVYSSAVEIENPNHPELVYARENRIKTSKRDELINKIIQDSGQKMIAIAGTHGKTTTTAMVIWLFKQLGVPISYSVGAKLSFGEMSEFNNQAEYFVYEADEYDRNFLHFKPEIAIIPGIDYDHPDIYPTREEYYRAFADFLNQSQDIYAHKTDMDKIRKSSHEIAVNESNFSLAGIVNRQNAQLVVQAMHDTSNVPLTRLIELMDQFPGVSRRFERVVDGVYSDYAHTPEKIKGALQMAREVAGANVVVVYEGLHNTRQHFIINELKDLFDGIKKLYIVPSYLAREDESLEMLTPEKLCEITQKPDNREPVRLDENLKKLIVEHIDDSDLVLCLTAGGGGSLDEWLRKEFPRS